MKMYPVQRQRRLVMQLVRRSLLGSLAAALSLAAIAVLPISGAGAAVIEVSTTADQAGATPGCSLRQAITAAQTDTAVGGCQAGAGADSIKLPPGNYRL